jgi:hypothetical protein
MRLSFQILILMAIAWQGVGKSRPATVDVYLNDRDETAKLLEPGTWVASGIFSRIGVHVKWHTGDPPAVAGRGAALQPAFGIRTVEYAPEWATWGVLASSELHGSSGEIITVYRDQLRRFLAEHPTLLDAAPGYILAHELAHVMQGIARHSATGILTPKWSADDFKHMKYRVLAFTRTDVELIHQGLARRLTVLVVRHGAAQPVAVSGVIGTAQPSIRIVVFDQAGVPESTLQKAVETARWIFQSASVQTYWIVCQASADPDKRCAIPHGSDYISVLLRPNGVGLQKTNEGMGLAVIVKGEPRVICYAFVEPARALANLAHGSVPVVLASILAHEVGHLRGLKHSAQGIMKSKFERSEIVEAESGRLLFDSRDAKALRASVEQSWIDRD